MTTVDILTAHNRTLVAGRAVATYSTNFNQAVCGSNGPIETISLPSLSFEKFRMHGVESDCRSAIVRRSKSAGCGGFYPTDPGLEAPAAKEMAPIILPSANSSGSHLWNWTGTGTGMGYSLPTASGQGDDKNNEAPNGTSHKWPPLFTGSASIFSAIPTPFGKPTAGDTMTTLSPGDNIDAAGSAIFYTPNVTTEPYPMTSQGSAYAQSTSPGPPSDLDPALLSLIDESCHPSGTHDPAFLYTCIRGLQSATETSQSLVIEAPSVTVMSSSESSPSTDTMCDVSLDAAI